MNDRYIVWKAMGYTFLLMALALALVAMLAMSATAQQRLESVDIVRSGYWQVVSPDTVTNHTDPLHATERQLNLLLAGVDPAEIVVKPPLYEVRPTYGDITPDTVWVESPPDTVWGYEERVLYATTIPDTEMHYYDEHEAVRNIDWQIMEDHPDSAAFRVRIFGTTTANSIRFASKCIGYDSAMNAIDDRVSMTLTPDSTGFVDGTTEDYSCHPPGGNASMNYWLTASLDSTDIIVRKYIDVAHIRSIGN